MELPEELKQAFRVGLEQYEREQQMRYITSIERMMREEIRAEGLQEGRQEERRELALKMLRSRRLPELQECRSRKFNNS